MPSECTGFDAPADIIGTGSSARSASRGAYFMLRIK